MLLQSMNNTKNNVSKKKLSKKHIIIRILILTLMLIGLTVSGKGLYMQSKAVLAQQLLSFAWARHLIDGDLHKAWPWADSAPFAQLTLPGEEPLIILSGASGSNLAFAPSWMVSSTPFSQGGNSVIVGHNDTHFNLLKNIKSDDEFTVSTYANSGLYYRVREVKVVNETDLSVIENSGGELVTLITCYPFDSETFNSKLRFVVTAERIKDTRSSITVAMVEKGD